MTKECLKNLLEQNNMTIKEFSDRFKFRYQTLLDYTAGNRNISKINSVLFRLLLCSDYVLNCHVPSDCSRLDIVNLMIDFLTVSRLIDDDEIAIKYYNKYAECMGMIF